MISLASKDQRNKTNSSSFFYSITISKIFNFAPTKVKIRHDQYFLFILKLKSILN